MKHLWLELKNVIKLILFVDDPVENKLECLPLSRNFFSMKWYCCQGYEPTTELRNVPALPVNIGLT